MSLNISCFAKNIFQANSLKTAKWQPRFQQLVKRRSQYCQGWETPIRESFDITNLLRSHFFMQKLQHVSRTSTYVTRWLFWVILTIFVSCIKFYWGSTKNWLKLEMQPRSPNLAPWNTLCICQALFTYTTLSAQKK